MSVSKILLPPLSSMPLGVPKYYGGVILVGCGAFGLHIFLASKVMQARKEHNVELGVYTFFPSSLVCWRTFSFCGLIYLAGRYFYYKGYATGDPEKRKAGVFSYVGLIPMLIGTLGFGVQHLIASVRSTCPCSYVK